MAKQSISLVSASLVNAPNVIRWAINNYKTGLYFAVLRLFFG